VRLVHAENNDTVTCKRVADEEISDDAHIVTAEHAGFSDKSLGERTHERKVQTKAEQRESDAVQGCHRTVSLAKRWLVAHTRAQSLPSTCRAISTNSPFATTAARPRAYAASLPASSKPRDARTNDDAGIVDQTQLYRRLLPHATIAA
jgi:hypothetical protein